MTSSAAGPRIGSLCSGYRGLDAAVEAVFGGTTAWVSDIDAGASKILAHHWPAVPNLGDLTTVDWSKVEPVDIVCGGYPCQPFSDAGLRKGTADERHIWPHIATALRVLRPRYAIFENVRGHLRRGFDTVLGDLAALGFDAEWCTVRASEVGAPHPRNRLFLLAVAADAANLGHERGGTARGRWAGPEDRDQSVADADILVSGHHGELPAGRDALRLGVRDDAAGLGAVAADRDGSGRGSDFADDGAGQSDIAWGRYEPAIRRWEHILGRPAPRPVDDLERLTPAFVEWHMGLPAGHVTGVPGLSRNAQLKALGNGVVPRQAMAALSLLLDRMPTVLSA